MNQHTAHFSLRKRILFSIIAGLAGLLLLEIGLRAAGVGKPPVIGKLQFGYDTGIPVYDTDGIEIEGVPYEMPLFEADALFYWKPIPETPFTGEGGLRRPVPMSKTKPAGGYRIAVLGDSCSFLGQQLYPERFAELASGQSGVSVDVVNASCAGYTSFQGMRRLETLWPWNPDLLVVYFGWNDHWKSLNGRTDAELAESIAMPRLQQLLQISRLYWTFASLRNRSPDAQDLSNAPVRVPLPDYRDNLQTIISEAQSRGCPQIFITAPTALVEGRLPTWMADYYAKFYAMSSEQCQAIPSTHNQYNAVVREVAADHNSAALLDLAKLWIPSESQGRFRKDGIHLTEAGHREAAQSLFELWRSQPGLAGRK